MACWRVRHRDLGELARRRAVELHVPRAPSARRAAPARSRRRHLELADQAELRHLLHARADPAAGVAGAAERQQHVLADAGADRGHARTGSRRPQLAPPIGVVAEKRRSGMPKLVMKSSATAPGPYGIDAVDVGRLQPGIVDRVRAMPRAAATARVRSVPRMYCVSPTPVMAPASRSDIGASSGWRSGMCWAFPPLPADDGASRNPSPAPPAPLPAAPPCGRSCG